MAMFLTPDQSGQLVMGASSQVSEGGLGLGANVPNDPTLALQLQQPNANLRLCNDPSVACGAPLETIPLIRDPSICDPMAIYGPLDPCNPTVRVAPRPGSRISTGQDFIDQCGYGKTFNTHTQACEPYGTQPGPAGAVTADRAIPEENKTITPMSQAEQVCKWCDMVIWILVAALVIAAIRS